MGRTLLGLFLVLAIFAGLSVLGWYFVEEKIRPKPEYRLSADRITVPEIPPWVPERFVEDVLKSSNLNQTDSLLDKTLPLKLTEAFAAHPWVERVEQVVPRYPSGADVKLSYRVPVALVSVPKEGIFLVDRYGVLLPPDHLLDPTANRQNEYLTIHEIRSTPLGSVGTLWGDPIVHTGAQLAATLTDVASPLKLAHIIPPSREIKMWRLQTAAGMEIRWGTFVSDDPKTEVKIKKLWQWHEQFRSLDNVPATLRPIDLSRE